MRLLVVVTSLVLAIAGESLAIGMATNTGFAVGTTVGTNDTDVPLRAAPSANAAVVETLAQGTQLVIIAPAQEAEGFTWWPVQDPATGAIGFVRAEFLSPLADGTATSEATSPSTTAFELVLQARPPAGTNVDGGVLSGLRDTIARRVAGLGLTSACISTRGDNQIVIEIEQVSDSEQVAAVLQKTALLEIIDPVGQYLPVGTMVRTSLDPNDTETATGQIYTTIIKGDDFKDVYVTTNQLGATVVGFELNGSASSTFYDFTSSHLGQPMSIVIDKKVVSSPVINGAISNQGIIEGFPAGDVNGLVVDLKAGALAVPVDIVESRNVSEPPPTPCSGESAETPSPTIGASDAAGVAVAAQVASLDPHQVLSLLLSASFSGSELPAGFSGATVGLWPEGDSHLEGTLGGVLVDLDGTEAAGIGYLVYPTPLDAQEAQKSAAREAGDGAEATTLPGLGLPVTLGISSEDAGCTVLVGNVVVLAHIELPGDLNPQDAATQVLSLAQAGVAHLEQVLSIAAMATTGTGTANAGTFQPGDQVVTTDNVNPRSSPSFDDTNIIVTLDAGTPLTVTGLSIVADGGGWVSITDNNGNSGYVDEDFLARALASAGISIL